MDLALDTDGDLLITDGDLSLLTGTDAITQHLRVRLRFFLGEWFIDQRIGIPFYESVLVKQPNLDVIRSIFREAIAETPGVLQIPRLDLSFDSVNRKLTIDTTIIVDGTDTPLSFTDELVIGG